MINNFRLLITLATVLALPWPLAARGQSPSPRLETLVVYGSRDYRPLYQVPSLTVGVDGESMRDPSFEHIAQMLAEAPGVQVSRGSGQEHLTAIRSPVLTGAGACGAFWMGQDGVSLRADGFCNVNQLFDAHVEAAENVQILKGPNAALLGGNALFGAIDISLPAANAVRDELRLDASQFGFKRLHGQGGWTADDHGLALFATFADDDGYRDDTGYSQQKISAKHQWAANNLSVEQSAGVTGLRQQTGGYVEGQDAYRDEQQRRSNPSPQAYRNAESLRYAARLTRNGADWQWSLVPYLRSNSMDFLMHFVPWQPVEENWQHSAGLMGQWKVFFDGGSVISVGQEVEFTQAGLSEIQYAPAPSTPDRFPEGAHYDYRVHATSAALSVVGYTRLNDSLALDWALRADYDRYDYRNRLQDGSACAPEVVGCRFYRPADRDDDFLEPSAQAGLVYEVWDNAYVFGRWSTGFRPPQASELYRAQSAEVDVLEPERSQAVELGIRLAVGESLVQLAAYRMQNREGIFQDTERRYVNGVDTRHTGVEYDVQMSLGPQLSLRASGQLARHIYTNQPSILGLGETADIDGNTMDSAPRNLHQIKLDWTPSPQWQLTGQWLYQGHYYLDAANDFRYPGHQLLRLAVARTHGPWQATASLHNALDTRYADRADVSFNTPRYFPGQERTLALGLRYRFD